jgi:hypothetical protein
MTEVNPCQINAHNRTARPISIVYLSL